MKKYIAILLIFFAIIGTGKANAADNSFRQKNKHNTTLSEKDLPTDLKDWAKWATDGYKKENCHYGFNNSEEKYCYYISVLNLNISRNTLLFMEKVSLLNDGYVRLPGSVSLFPYDVKANNKAIPVVNIDSFPYLFLGKGEYTIIGKAKTVGAIRSLNIPNDVAILNIKKNGKSLNFANVDSNGILRLESENNEKTESDAIDVLAFRKIEDSIPIKMTLSLDLNVSGKDRLETFKDIIPENFALINVSSNIPAYVQKNGDLVAEVRSGKWNITLEFRQLKESLNFSTKNLVNDNEIWVFVGNQDRRIIQMPKTMMSISTKNTLLPESWKQYPAYNIEKNSSVSLNAVNYNTPQEDVISLTRNIKLSFDGKFYSVYDILKASLKNDGRMYLEAPFNLSSVAMNGVPQAITKIKDENINGFEVRRGNYTITANSRIERNKDKIAASGYNKIMKNVVWNLDLAPGYDLFYVGGADSVSNSWVSNWNLLNIFMVILLIVFFYYLFDIKKAVIGGVLILLMHPLLPQFTIVCFVLCANILIGRYTPNDSIFYKINRYVKYTLLLLLGLTIISFMIIHIRWAIYPSLIHPNIEEYFANFLAFSFLIKFYGVSVIIFLLSSVFAKENEKSIAKVIKIAGIIYLSIYAINTFMVKKSYYRETTKYTTMEQNILMNDEEISVVNETKVKNSVSMYKKERSAGMVSSISNVKEQLDGGAQYQNQNIVKNKIQTGLGFPNWSGSSTIKIELKGPVNSLDEFNIFLISPTINIVLAFARLLLSIYVIYFMLNINLETIKHGFDRVKKVFYSIILLILIGLTMPSGLNAEEIKNLDKSTTMPSQDMLEQLKNKLTKETAPTCIPFCVSIPNGSIANNGNNLTLNLSIHSADSVVISLPMLQADNSNGVKVEAIKNNGKNVKNTIKRDNSIFLQLQEGINNITIEMVLDNSSNKFFLSSIVPINYLKNYLKGFKIEGDNNKNQSFQITRIVDDKKKNNSAMNLPLSKINIETFFTINRFIDLGNIWQVQTIVVRNNNIGENAVIEVPLLNNEKVITGDGKLLANSLVLSFAPNETRKTFNSIIPIESLIKLQYTDNIVNYNEVWSLNVDFMWNFKLDGLAPIAKDGEQMVFYPASGDTLNVFVSQPEGIDGNILTFKKVDYKFKPGRSMQELKLNLIAESSESTFHNIIVPESSEVKNLKINGENYPVILDKNDLVLPINQGITNIEFTINLNRNISNILKFPKINLKAPSVDITEEAYVPVARWILFANGPLIGPSVLFWTQIPIWLCVAYILSRFAFFPLNFLQWFILLFGLSQTNIIFTLIIISWFAVISIKNYLIDNFGYKKLVYTCIAIISLLFLYSTFEGINNGLLGTWNMKIIGNNSQLIYENGNQLWKLIWYQDVSNGELPQAKIISLSIWFYRGIMILWSIWLSFSFVRWVKWALMSLRDENRISF